MSVFTMDDVHTVMAMPNLTKAKEFALAKVAATETLRDATRVKANRIISGARSNTNLGMSMSNWILAHPDEGLKVVNG